MDAGTHRITRVATMLVGLLIAVAAIAPAAHADAYDPADWSPSIWSDQADYAPGALVTLNGANWQPGEAVNIVVNDDAGQTWSRNVNVTAGAAGTITDSFNLPDYFVAAYSVRATGASGAVATTSFTDGNVDYGTTRVPAASFQSVTAGQAFNFNINADQQGGGAAPVVDALDVGNGATNDCGTTTNPMPASWLSITSPPLPKTITGPTTFALRAQPPANATLGDYRAQVKFHTSAGGSGSGFVLCLRVTSPDSTPPSITPNVTGTLGNNGWYTSNVSLTWTVNDPESTVTSTSGCGPTSITADQAATTYTCSATSTGGAASNSVTIKRDATAPAVTVALDRAADHNGWYNHAVGYGVSASNDATSGIALWEAGGNYNGPDSAGASVSRSFP